MKTTDVKCKICSSSQTEIIKRDDKDYIQCKNCGLFFVKDYPSEEKYAMKFEQDFIMAPREYLNAEHRRIFRIAGQLEFLSEISKYKRKPSKILDIGCGHGFFLDEARRHGYTVKGLELSQSARYFCNNIGIPVLTTLEEVNEKFDIAVLHNTLVKTPNPLNIMNIINNILNEKGYIFIKVPFKRSKYWKILESPEDRFFKQIYLQYYTKKSLKKLIELTGFELLKIECRKSRKGHERKLYRIICSVFKKYFSLEFTFFEKFKRSFFDSLKKEIFVVARKK
ncbi:class I SAM-dependent methyltransferase [Bacteroidota bacterium]